MIFARLACWLFGCDIVPLRDKSVFSRLLQKCRRCGAIFGIVTDVSDLLPEPRRIYRTKLPTIPPSNWRPDR